MNITSAKYLKKMPGDKESCTIVAVWDGITHFVPINEENTDYAEILKQVKEGKLTIKDAD
tara:strand:- start:398 stop:577 length:180 start_codon:yes stop_codon:yes gene_type:complete